MEEEGIALSNTIFSEHWPKDTKALGARLSRMLSSFLRPLPRPLISSRDASWRYAPLRYASLRYASMRYAYLRYASLRYAYLRYAFSRYAYLCYAFYHSVCLSSFWLDAWYLKRVFALQLRLDAFPICSIELVLWTDACTIWIIWYQFLLIEFCHRYTSIVLRWTVFIYFSSYATLPSTSTITTTTFTITTFTDISNIQESRPDTFNSNLVQLTFTQSTITTYAYANHVPTGNNRSISIQDIL